jgi:hypothetical protein
VLSRHAHQQKCNLITAETALDLFVVFVGGGGRGAAAAAVVLFYALFLCRCVLPVYSGGPSAGTVLLLTQHVHKQPLN